jgi:hypothetical protein
MVKQDRAIVNALNKTKREEFPDLQTLQVKQYEILCFEVNY